MGNQVVKFLQQENQRLLEENRLLRDKVTELRGYLEGLRSLQQAAEAITVEEDPQSLLDKILYFALTIIDAAAGSILLLDDETGELVFVIVRGELGTQLPGYRMPGDEGIAGWVATNGEPLVVNNARTDQRFSAYIDETFDFVTNSLLCMPMISRGKVLGVIEVLNKFNQQNFNDTDADLLSTLAYIAATTIDLLENQQVAPV